MSGGGDKSKIVINRGINFFDLTNRFVATAIFSDTNQMNNSLLFSLGSNPCSEAKNRTMSHFSLSAAISIDLLFRAAGSTTGKVTKYCTIKCYEFVISIGRIRSMLEQE